MVIFSIFYYKYGKTKEILSLQIGSPPTYCEEELICNTLNCYFPGDHAFPKMEIIRNPASKFESLSTPKLMVKPEKANVALYSYQHKEVVRPQVLSCHLLPGVNIRPALGK